MGQEVREKRGVYGCIAVRVSPLCPRDFNVQISIFHQKIYTTELYHPVNTEFNKNLITSIFTWTRLSYHRLSYRWAGGDTCLQNRAKVDLSSAVPHLLSEVVNFTHTGQFFVPGSTSWPFQPVQPLTIY